MKQQTSLPIALKWGIIVALSNMLFTILMFFLNINSNSPTAWLSYLVVIAGLFVAMKEYRDDNSVMSFGEAFKLGMQLILVSAVISSLFFIFYVYFINTNLIEQILLQTEEKMRAQGQPDEVIEQSMGYVKMYMTPIMMSVMGFISMIIMGAIFSVAMSFFMRRDPQ